LRSNDQKRSNLTILIQTLKAALAFLSLASWGPGAAAVGALLMQISGV
jgi:hypothetical protein